MTTGPGWHPSALHLEPGLCLSAAPKVPIWEACSATPGLGCWPSGLSPSSRGRLLCSRSWLMAGALLLRLEGSGCLLPESSLCLPAPQLCLSCGTHTPLPSIPQTPNANCLPASVCLPDHLFPVPQRRRSRLTTQAKQRFSRCIRQDPRSILRQLAEPTLHGSEPSNTSTAHSICQNPLPQLWWVTDDPKASDTLYSGEAGIHVPSLGGQHTVGSDPVPVSGSSLKTLAASTSYPLEHCTLGEAWRKDFPGGKSTSLGLPAAEKPNPGPWRGTRKERLKTPAVPATPPRYQTSAQRNIPATWLQRRSPHAATGPPGPVHPQSLKR